MNWFEAFILGMIQGISEFLPISSSAHLVIAQNILGLQINAESLTFEVFLHFASLLAVICFFWKDIVKILKDFFSYLMTKKKEYETNYKFALYIFVATIITMIVGKGLEEFLGNRLVHMSTIGAALIITGIFLIFIEHGVSSGTRDASKMTIKDAIIIGLGQALAIIPGISRAGNTLIVSLWCGLTKETAVRYSFLLSIPLILGITIIKIPDLIETSHTGGVVPLTIAFVSSFFFALIGIKWLIQMLNKARLSYFAIYCIALGLFTWIFLSDVIMPQ